MIIEPTVEKMDWGQVSLIMKRRLEQGAEVEAGVFICEPDKKLDMHDHQGADEYCWVFEGQAIFEIAGQKYEVGAGQVILIPKDVEHTSYPADNQPFSSFYMVCP